MTAHRSHWHCGRMVHRGGDRAGSRWIVSMVISVLLALVPLAGGALPAAATPPAVGTPTADAEVLAARVSWPAAAGATSYRIVVSPGSAVVEVPVAVTSWVVQGLTAGTSYTFAVQAVTAEGEGVQSPASNAVVPEAPGGAFRPLLPERVLDTRKGVGAPLAKVGAKETLVVDVTGVGGVPASGVGAVVLNVTAVGASSPTHLTVFPAGTTRPSASSLNVFGGDAVPNLVEVKVGAGGEVAVFNNAGSVDVIFDVAGYVLAPEESVGSEGLYAPLAPARILDTRKGTGAPLAPVGPGASVDLQVTGQGGVPSTGVAAVVLNVTATNASAATFVTAYPNGAARPATSNLNVAAGQTVPNRVVVKVGSTGKVTLFNRSGAVDLIADVSGWYAAAGGEATGASFTGVDPARVLDTRKGVGGPTAPVVAGTPRRVQIAGAGGVPSMDGPVPPPAVVANITVTGPSASSFLVAWPHGTPKPLASDLNFTAGQTVPNLAVVKLGGDGAIDVGLGSGSSDVIVDVLGWYAGDQATAWNLEVLAPASITGVTPTTVTLGAPNPAVGIGDIVASGVGTATPGGLLRRVVGASGLTLTTVEATLTDAIVNGTVSTGPADQANPSTMGPATSLGADKTVYFPLPPGSPLLGSLSGEFGIGLDLSVHSTDAKRIGLAAGGVEAKTSMALVLIESLTAEDTKSWDLPPQVSSPIVTLVGGVPFVARVHVEPSIVLLVSGAVDVDLGVDIDRESKIGVAAVNGVVTSTESATGNALSGPQAITGDGSVTVSADIPVRLEINGAGALEAGFSPYASLAADPCRQSATAGQDGRVALRLGAKPPATPQLDWSKDLAPWTQVLEEHDTGACRDWAGTIELTGEYVRSYNDMGFSIVETSSRTYKWTLSGDCTTHAVTDDTFCEADLAARMIGEGHGPRPTICGEDPGFPTVDNMSFSWDSGFRPLEGAEVHFAESTTSGVRYLVMDWFHVTDTDTYPISGSYNACSDVFPIVRTGSVFYDGTYSQFFPKIPLAPDEPWPTSISGTIPYSDPAAGFHGEVTYNLSTVAGPPSP